MRLIKLLSIALLVFAFSVSAATRIPLIERFTNIGCGYCPPCGQMVDSLTGVYGSALSAVEVHVDWTIPTDPYYVADAADCEERWTHYGITGVPAVAVDGKKLAYWSTAPAEISTRMGVTSPIDMSISTTDSSIIVSVDVESALVGSGYRLLTAVVEDSNYLPSAPNGEVWANNVQRKLYPSSTGEAIDLSAVGTQVFEYPFTWDLEWNPLMCGVVAWVQDLSAAVTSCNIVNSALGILPLPAYFFTYVPNEVQAVVWSDTAIVLDAGVLTNHGTNSDTYSLKIEKDLPPGWSSSYCAGASCFPDSGSITLPPDSGVGIDVDFFTAGDGVGTVYFIVASIGSGAVDTIQYQVVQSPTILLVDDDKGAPYQDYYSSSLDDLREVYMTFDRAASTLSAADMSAYEIVIWFTSADYSDVVPSEDRDAIGSYLLGGGKLFMTSQDLGWYCNEVGAISWYSSYFRASYLADDSGVRSVAGSAGTPFGGLSLSLFTGDGASFTPYPSKIDTVGGSISTFTYGTSSDIAGLVYDGAYRLVYFAFPFEAINGAALRDTVMARALSFLRAGLAVEERVTLPEKPLLVNASPNPFNSAIAIEFESAGDRDVELSIYDIDGRKVAQLLDEPLEGGHHRTIWNGRSDLGEELPSGIYLVRLDVGDKTATGKILLAK